MADVLATIENFTKKGFKVSFFETSAEAIQYLEKNIQKTTVGIGGSVTVRDIGLDLALAKTNAVIFPMRDFANTSPDKVKLANQAKVYISSVNAISEEGAIVNIDGLGNRIAGGAYGAERVYFVTGVNKIEKNLEDAIYRARNIAAPLNARRLQLPTPCTFGELKCHDCSSPERICNIFTVLDRPLKWKATEVILINEILGF